jgi:hypothetical protein
MIGFLILLLHVLISPFKTQALEAEIVLIVNHTKRKNYSSIQFQKLASSIISHSIRDQHLDFHASQGLPAKRIKEIADELTLIAAGNDDGYADIFTWLHVWILFFVGS